MSIHAFTGLPGSGKSYGVVANEILPALRAGRVVVTNIPLHEELIRKSIPGGEIRELPVEKIAQEPALIEEYATPGCLLVIDELWRLFPAGQKVNQVPEAFKRLLAEHRHMVDAEGRSMQIVFVTQDLAQIGAFARQLVEQTFLHTKLGHLGMSGTYKCNIYHGPQTGQNPPKSSELRSILGRYKKDVYQYYQSHTMSQSASAGADERPVDTRGNVWKRPGFIIGAVAAVVVIAVAWHVLGNFFGKKPPPAAPAHASGATMRSSDQPAGLVPSARAVAAQPRYRLSVVIDSGNPALAVAAIESDSGEVTWLTGSRCIRERMEWRCEYKRKWWTLAGLYSPPRVDSRPLVGPAQELASLSSASPSTL